MTRPVRVEVERRQVGYQPRPRNLLEDLGRFLIAQAMGRGGAQGDENLWPSEKYRDDPVAFFVEVLGVKPWARQIEIIEAIRDHRRVAVRSGHKVGKSLCIAGIALWFYCCFESARVVMTSTTSRQVDRILWRELRMRHAKAIVPIDGELAERAATGLVSDDFREVVGFTAREAEAVAGVSGANLLYLIDEASGVPEIIFQAIQGNRAGGAREAMFSNPTLTEGRHFDAFHEKSELFKCITISSEESPNVVEGTDAYPGLATREWIEEMKEEYGEDSALYKIRVKGIHVLNEDGKIISVHEIMQAEQRWDDAPTDGELAIGLDPAGDSGDGDESAFAPKRAKKILALILRRGLNEDGHLSVVLGIIAEFGRQGETVRVILDSEGSVGAKVYAKFVAYLSTFPEAYQPFVLVRVRSSEKAQREPLVYHRVRDELWANLRSWIRDEGAIPTDTKIAKELHAPAWIGDASGRVKATPKDELRKFLGRSPDRADACCLAVWGVDHAHRIEQERKAEQLARVEDLDSPAPTAIDPWGGLDAFRPR